MHTALFTVQYLSDGVIKKIESGELETHRVSEDSRIPTIDVDNYLKALDEIGYKGFLTIEREVGDNPAADIALAAEFLRSKIK